MNGDPRTNLKRTRLRNNNSCIRRHNFYRVWNKVLTNVLYNRELLRLAAQLYRWPLERDFQLSIDKTARPCGSSIKIGLDLDSDSRITALGLECRSCAFGQASAAIFAGYALGLEQADILAARNSVTGVLLPSEKQVSEPLWPELSSLKPASAHATRHPAILLVYDAVLTILSESITRADQETL